MMTIFIFKWVNYSFKKHLENTCERVRKHLPTKCSRYQCQWNFTILDINFDRGSIEVCCFTGRLRRSILIIKHYEMNRWIVHNKIIKKHLGHTYESVWKQPTTASVEILVLLHFLLLVSNWHRHFTNREADTMRECARERKMERKSSGIVSIPSLWVITFPALLIRQIRLWGFSDAPIHVTLSYSYSSCSEALKSY